MENKDYIVIFNKFLRKQATPEEVSLLIQWLKSESSFSAWADEQWEAVSSDMDSILQQKLLGQIKNHIVSTTKMNLLSNRNIHSVYQWAIRVAAMLLLLLATGLSVYHYTEARMIMPDMVVAVDKGQKAHITLPDGSKVWVNSDSKLSYGSHFNSHERILNLVGEAYFEVSPDKTRPFIVKTNALSVKALGTSFNVKSYNNDREASTVLMSGKVEVQSKYDRNILYPNEQIIVNKLTGLMKKHTLTEADVYSSWRYNVLVFNAETFEKIANTLERLYNTRIIFKSENLKKQRFTGTLGNTSLESILEVLSLTSPLSYKMENGELSLDENIEKKKQYEHILK